MKRSGWCDVASIDLGREALAALVSRESLSTAAIEGEQLDPVEVRSSVARRFQLPPDMPGSPQREASAKVEGLVQLLLASTAELDEPLTLAALHRWHADLFAGGPDGLRAIAIGDWRGSLPMQVVSGAIGRETLHFEAPPREGLERQLTLLLDWFNGPSLELDGLIREGLAHLWFVTLHPYDDGNGRLARALTDRALAQISRPEVEEKPSDRLMAGALGLSARIQQQRRAYYRELGHCQRGVLEVTRWLRWFLEQVAAKALANQAVGGGAGQGAVLVAAPPQRLQCTAAEAAQPPARCLTRRFRRGDDAAQSDLPHQGEPGHGLARSQRAGGAPGP